MTQGSPKTNAESGQSDIWTQKNRMKIQHPDHWAMLPPWNVDDDNDKDNIVVAHEDA